MSIGKSSIFQNLMGKYAPKEKGGGFSNAVIDKIKKSEDKIEFRIPLGKINSGNTIESMNNALEMIEVADETLSLCCQLTINVEKKKVALKNLYNIEKIRVNNLVEVSEVLTNIKSKTEREGLKKFLMTEQLITLENEMEESRFDEQIAKNFEEDAKRLREFTYAYYQAVKKIFGGS